MNIIYFLSILPLCHGLAYETENFTVPGERFPNNWMEMPLDHFNLFDNKTWKMRFYQNDEFFLENKPIFIEVGGEATMSGRFLTTGQLHKLAKQHNGMLVETEHRFYGKSIPVLTVLSDPDELKNYSPEDLHFLQIEQALEDLAYFIDKYKNSDPKFKNSPVVLHGGSYPGMLATWMRLRFPNLVDMAYASSAPLGVGLDYPEYYEIVNDVYANVSVSCIDTIREGFNRTAKLMKTSAGRKKVQKALKDWDCGNVEDFSSGTLLHFMMNILNVQGGPLQFEEVSCLILTMDLDDTSAFERLARLIVLKSKASGACSRGDDKPIGPEVIAQVEEFLRNAKAWSYQTCTEQGTFQTLSRSNSRNPFSQTASVEESVDECVKEFGGIVTEQVLRNGIERVTRRYGGKRPKVTKLVTVQGIKDPWRDLASLEDYTPEAPVLLANGNHCIDISVKEDDPPDLIEVRRKARQYITDWLNEMEK